MAGFLEVRRVPGSFGFRPALDGMSANMDVLNMTHTVHDLFFGPRVTAYQLSRLPADTGRDLHRQQGAAFTSPAAHSVHEHYLSVVHSPFRFASGYAVDAYRYTAASHVYEPAEEADGPSVRWRYEISPMSIVSAEHRLPFYHWVTNLCAILGGAYLLVSLLDSGVHTLSSAAFKVGIGKRA